jgi:hypothetical protein
VIRQVTEARAEDERDTIAQIPTMAPAMVVRTGTPAGPRLRSSAIRTPAVTVTGRPARTLASATAERLPELSRLPVRSAVEAATAARHAGHSASATTMAVVPVAPVTRTTVSQAKPGDGSAARARPMGVSGDKAIATPTVRAAPTAPMAAQRATAALVISGSAAAGASGWMIRYSRWPGPGAFAGEAESSPFLGESLGPSLKIGGRAGTA